MQEILDIQYIGEWAWAEQLGQLCAITAMIAALLSALSYFSASQWQERNLQTSNSWKQLARKAFYVNAIAVLGIIAIMFLLILNHRFEFKYVWQHSSLDLPVYYMVSCFWEGQEGSFLLWAFWVAVLSLVLIATARKWEAPVMTFMMMMQVFLAAMLLGIYFFGYKIGSDPFMLLRDDPSNINAPIFMRANYLEFITDGTGLNPLLQNYWMVIHPPTLFLGFAGTLVPFAFVMAGLWKRDFGKDWIQPTLKWSLFAAAVLGTGVLMGGAWAYEALSFGGFWAWDPVENASLVPWITLIAGLHTLLAFKNTGHALKATAIFLTLTLWLVLYSTFLTRSGILGDTSVHSFTDLGMSGQLLTFMLSFMFISAYLILSRWNAMPSPEKEESAYSREFWMFVGALVMTMLAVLVTVDTSWPVINKLFGTNRVITEPIPHYNRYSVWFGIFIALFSALVQYFRYKREPLNKLMRSVVFSGVLAAALTSVTALAVEINYFPNVLLLFTAFYAVVANASYIFTGLNGQLKIAGGSVSHIGFGLILAGAIFAFGKQEVISLNTLGIDYGEEWTPENKMENVLLYKDKPIQMNDYWVTYQGDSIAPPNTYYKVHYAKKENLTDKPTESFTLYPNAQKNPNMGLIANPSTKHYFSKDIFTHISAATDKELQKEEEGEQLTEIEVGVGETALVSGVMIRLQRINPNPDGGLAYIPVEGDIAAGAELSIVAKDNAQYEANPIYYIRDNQELNVEAIVEELNMTIRFDKIFPEKNKIKLSILDREDPMDWIIMKAVVFPYINVLWVGCFVMVIGFIMSILYRNKEGKQIEEVLRKKEARIHEHDHVEAL